MAQNEKFEVIKKIMDSEKLNENDKVQCIEMFLKGWFSIKDIEWIWSDKNDKKDNL